MHLVSLTTDYGMTEYYVGALKACLYAKVPDVTLLDITHSIPMDRLSLGAYQLRTALPCFPANTIHLLCVNEFLYPDHGLLIARKKDQWIVAPNNGILSLLAEEFDFGPVGHPGGSNTVDRWQQLAQITFALCHQYGYVESLSEPSELIQRMDIHPVVFQDQIRTKVYHIDNFGNVILNLPRDLFEMVGGDRRFVVQCRNYTYEDGLQTHLSAVGIGEISCFFNDGGYMQLSAFQQEADQLIGLKLEDTVNVEFLD